jgi:hypothetical protein
LTRQGAEPPGPSPRKLKNSTSCSECVFADDSGESFMNLEADEKFKLAFANCLMIWHQIEEQIYLIFEKTTKMHPLVARAVFFSASGFNGRIGMLQSAIRPINFTDLDYKKYIEFLLKRSQNYAGIRNKLVHGAILRIGFEGAKYFQQTIILDGGQHWVADPPPDKALTIDTVGIISVNFTNFLAYLNVANAGPPSGMPSDFGYYHNQTILLPNDARLLPSDNKVGENVIPLLNSLRL